ncbi:MAG: tetratricopeptide repeat protein, partial [Candidatus Heimdallarchaeota archaeon]
DKKNYEYAIKLFEKSIALNPFYHLAYNNLGVVYAMIGDLSEAIEQFKTAVELAPDYFEALHNLASAFEEAGDLEQAEIYKNKAYHLEEEEEKEEE